MTLNDLLLELERLTQAEKLHVIQHLAHNLESEENSATPSSDIAFGRAYEVWSPQDAGEAVATLHKLLQEHDQGNNAD
jgi:hypothetical protein